MLIVITQDPRIIEWCYSRGSNADAWGDLVVLTAGSNPVATVQLRHALQRVRPYEPLCLDAHGNDTELGDANSTGMSWWWSVQEIAGLLAAELPEDYAAPILIKACGNTVANFSANTAVALGGLQSLGGVWIYGYNDRVSITHPFPSPAGLDRNVDLQSTQVPPS
jgi:hypothetical protein